MIGAGVRPLIVLTGFLGSGKTTLLRRALTGTEARGTAVLVNEFGEIGLDHLQYTALSERTVLLKNGCLCCVTREDLSEALRELVELEESGSAPRFERIVLETSGLADPRPIISTVDRDPLLGHRFRVAVISTCDAEHAPMQAAYPEWQAQIACADLIAVTKADRAGPAAAARVTATASRRNPAARIADASRIDPLRTPLQAPNQIAEEAPDHGHTSGVSTASVAFDRPVDPELVTVWLSAVLHAHGPMLMRIKALLDTGGTGPLVLDAVQHTVYPPHHLVSWSGPRRSALVAITRGLDARLVTQSFAIAAGWV